MTAPHRTPSDPQRQRGWMIPALIVDISASKPLTGSDAGDLLGFPRKYKWLPVFEQINITPAYERYRRVVDGVTELFNFLSDEAMWAVNLAEYHYETSLLLFPPVEENTPTIINIATPQYPHNVADGGHIGPIDELAFETDVIKWCYGVRKGGDPPPGSTPGFWPQHMPFVWFIHRMEPQSCGCCPSEP